MQVAALVSKGKIGFYNYTNRPAPYSGTLEQRLPVVVCDVLRTFNKNSIVWFVALDGEGLLEVTVLRHALHLFTDVSTRNMIAYLIAVHRGQKPKTPGYELRLIAVPCFIENGVVFSMADIRIRNQVKTMR
jgi:hypothetical protein